MLEVAANRFSDGQARSAAQLWEQFYEFNVASDTYDRRTRELGRVTALVFWWDQNAADFFHTLIGHGPGSTRVSQTMGLGEAAAPGLVGDRAAGIGIGELHRVGNDAEEYSVQVQCGADCPADFPKGPHFLN